VRSLHTSKILVGIAVSALFTGLAFSLAAYFYTINDASGSILGPASDWWAYSLAIGLIFGFVVGGVCGTLIVSLNLRLWQALIIGGLVNLLIVGGLLLLTEGGGKNFPMKCALYSLIPIGLLNGLVACFFASSTGRLD